MSEIPYEISCVGTWRTVEIRVSTPSTPLEHSGSVIGNTTRALVFPLGLVGLLASSAEWVWHMGHHARFVVDQSVVFEGARRLLQGLVPYRDFVMPFGPVTFAIQALMFRLLGVDFSTMVLTAGLLSVIAVVVIARLLWILTGSAALSLLAGLLTAAWYQAPCGIPCVEQTGFLFDMIAIWAIVEGGMQGRSSTYWCAAAGIASMVAVLSKQNIGAPFVLVCVGALWLRSRGCNHSSRRSLLAYAAGLVATATVFAVWLWAYSDASVFVHHSLSYAWAPWINGIAPSEIPGTFFFQSLVPGSVPLFVLSSLAGAATLATWRAESLRAAGATPMPTETVQSGWLALALPQFHAFVQLTTHCDAVQNNTFVGVCAVCSLALVRRFSRGDSVLEWSHGSEFVRKRVPGHRLRTGVTIVIGVLSGCSLAEGLIAASQRDKVDTWTSWTDREEPTRLSPGSTLDRCSSRPSCRSGFRPDGP